MATTYKIPKKVNESLIVLFFTLEQFIPIAVAIALGYTFKAVFESIIFAILYFKITSYFAQNHPRGYVEHSLWYLGIMPMKLGYKTPDPLKREFIK
ncbi:type IV conjugative transfer system protein TraL [Shewanella sp. UCD-KL12]|uniref:type IV conjugative transfer system protein TraL n=1 Tax=Shewanella sp. UCD-KL12 TaxID=1917163 RepID=UPI000970833D|nr:type IV conjugative transfer system protein TraL [Shewanella sp. UCD-KL12]